MISLVKLLLELYNVDPEDFRKAYKWKINKEYDNLIEKGEKSKNFHFILSTEIKKEPCGQANKCETNSWAFVKDKLEKGEDYWYPVGGFGFEGKNLFPVEHWWVYNKKSNEFIEITPLQGEAFRCYAGVINFDINDEIEESKKFHDIDFFKGGHVQHKYFK